MRRSKGPLRCVQVAALVLELAARAAPASADEPPRTDEAPRSDDASRDRPANEAPKPPPLHVEYAQYGVAFAVESALSPGATCPPDTPTVKAKPCILGSGGGLAMRAGYRNPGSFYVGGAYEFTKMDSQNLYRLGIFQQLRAEARYIFDLGYRASPYLQAGIGAVAYGNEWGIETGGGQLFAGLGVEAEVSRLAVLGLGVVYRPTLIAAWKDTAGQERPLGVAQFFGIDLILEVRTVLGRR